MAFQCLSPKYWVNYQTFLFPLKNKLSFEKCVYMDYLMYWWWNMTDVPLFKIWLVFTINHCITVYPTQSCTYLCFVFDYVFKAGLSMKLLWGCLMCVYWAGWSCPLPPLPPAFMPYAHTHNPTIHFLLSRFTLAGPV